VISPPSAWQKRLAASDIEVMPRIETPVEPAVVDDLYRRFHDFRRAYNEGGIDVGDFNDFAPTRRTLRQFLGACGDLSQLVRDILIPNPDAR